MTIADNDLGLRLEFGSVREDEGAVQVRVSRGDDGSVPVHVQYWTQGHTALAGEDYVETTGDLDFAVGEESKYITIPILNDLQPETRESFWLHFSVPTAAGRYLATISIVDNDADRGVAFDSQSSWLLENRGSITVKAYRNNDLDLGGFTVGYATSDGTATAGQDYGEIKGTLAFAPGELVKLLTIPITGWLANVPIWSQASPLGVPPEC